MLETLVSSKIRRALLEYLLTHPDTRFYLRGLAKELNLAISPVRRELKRLEQLGVLKAYDEGNMRFYLVNQSCPFFLQLRRTAMPGSVSTNTPAPAEVRMEAPAVSVIRPPEIEIPEPVGRATAAEVPAGVEGEISATRPLIISHEKVQRIRRALTSPLHWPMIAAAVGLGLVMVVGWGVSTYLAMTNQQLLSLTSRAMSVPKSQITVVESGPVARSAQSGEMHSSRWLVLPGTVGGFSTRQDGETY